MGRYTNTYIFYGCPITLGGCELQRSITPHPKKLSDKIAQMSFFEKMRKNIMSIEMKENYFITDNDVFLIVPRTKMEIAYKIDLIDVANGYVKISELKTMKVVKSGNIEINPALDIFPMETDIIPTKKEHDTFIRYINALIRNDKKTEMYKLMGLYMVEVVGSTLDVIPTSIITKKLPILNK